MFEISQATKQVPETSIVRFRLRTSCYPASRIKDWFSFLIERNVKELDLNFDCYCLARSVLNATSLTVLKLCRMTLRTRSLSTLHSLKVLSLIDVIFDAKSLKNIISGCPIIEELYVHRESYARDHVDFSVSKTLKYLLLSGLQFNCQWLEGLIYGLPLLEGLTLYSCIGLKNIRIGSHSLKSLYFSNDFVSENLSIDSHSLTTLDVYTRSGAWKATFRTPNLVYLRLHCGVKAVISIQAPNLFEGILDLGHYSKYVPSYDDTVHFLANFNSMKKMMLRIDEQEIIFPRNIRNTCSPPLPNLKHLKLKIRRELKTKSELEDSVYWCAPSLETLELDVMEYCNRKHLKVKMRCNELKRKSELEDS
ncbi:hypothetical protein FNV43_RR01690 [Rhamnella rubrinervis]|uniref:F-box/LRR-repeat protein 15/At3g58940/PEG3-like LRR domain-containing protein n=1 Tax=Rhamnella rubrinervis TaxID=2594499 RepID=A0A8K0HSS6_9ROSA|nr:hypothetical protein FNV43_RR01690 [Rhamnella rubrinervis]